MATNKQARAYAEKITRLEADCARKDAALRWALGESDSFPVRQPGQGAYWWRAELRRRAALAPAAPEPECKCGCGGIGRCTCTPQGCRCPWCAEPAEEQDSEE